MTPRRDTRTYVERYRALEAQIKDCPVELGLIGNLADNECKHGRLPGDKSAACGCFVAVKVKGKR